MSAAGELVERSTTSTKSTSSVSRCHQTTLLSAAARFQSMLPAIEQLDVPTILKLYLQFDGPLSEVNLSIRTPTRP